MPIGIKPELPMEYRLWLSQRVKAGLKTARQAGRIGGRPQVRVNWVKLVSLNQAGWTTREIGERLGISAATVCRILQYVRRFDADGAISQKRPKKRS